MIKRTSILFNTELRDRVERDAEFGACPGMREALRFVSALQTMAPHPRNQSGYTANHWRLQKYFDGNHCERQELGRYLKSAARMEAVLNLETGMNPIEGVLVEIQLHGKGRDNNIFFLRVSFRAEDGVVAYCS